MGFACMNLDSLFAVVLMPFKNSSFPMSLLSKERRKVGIVGKVRMLEKIWRSWWKGINDQNILHEFFKKKLYKVKRKNKVKKKLGTCEELAKDLTVLEHGNINHRRCRSASRLKERSHRGYIVPLHTNLISVLCILGSTVPPVVLHSPAHWL